MINVVELADKMTKDQLVKMLFMIAQTQDSVERHSTPFDDDWTQGCSAGKGSLCDDLLEIAKGTVVPQEEAIAKAIEDMHNLQTECTYCGGDLTYNQILAGIEFCSEDCYYNS